MSLDLDSRLRVVLASVPQTVRSISVLQFSHSTMTQVFYLWREPYEGAVTLEDGSVVTVQPLNFEEKLAGSEENLDQNFQINLDTTDIEDTFREQMDLVPLDSSERVECVYREYLSDDITAIVAGPAVLQVEAVSYQIGAATITACSPRLNVTSTGEIYAPRDCPTLRGFT
jgi:hypothetical protein